jgi:hypothetical protein
MVRACSRNRNEERDIQGFSEKSRREKATRKTKL